MSVKEGDSLSLFGLPDAPPSPSPDPLSAEKDSPKDPQFDDAFSAMSSLTDRSISLSAGDDEPEANLRSMEDPTTLSREGPGKDVLVDENVEQSGNSRGDTLGKVLTKPHLSGGDSTSTTREEGPGKAILVEEENVEPSNDSDLNSLGKVPSNPHSLGGISTSTSEEGLDKGNMKVSLVDENVTLSDNCNPDPLGKGSTKPTHAREEEEKEEENLTLGDLINGEHVQSGVWDEAKKEIDTDRHRSNGDSDEKDDRISEENGDSKIHSFPPSHIDSAASSRDSKGLTSFPTSNEPFKQPSTKQTGSGVDLLQNITAGDEEGRSRQRILAFAAKRYASAVERNPNDYDALYNWALILQESADNINLDAGSPGKDQLLEEACKKYDEATRLCPTLHEAFYNWAIAISDRAKIRGRTKEAEDLWKQACKKYEEAVQLNWNSPQALNNWGLALQELSGIVPVKDKRLIVRTAIKKFRAAILLQFDFHRAIYNLGTVLYGLAEDTFRSGKQNAAKELTSSDLYGQSAVYIASAHALKPEYPVYRSALRLVRSMLPLPYLKTGFLMVPPDGNSLAPHSDWKRLLFALDHEALFQLDRAEQDAMDIPSLSDKAYALHVEIADIALAAPCGDLTLPPGGGIRIDTAHSQLYLVADTWEAVDCWVDAIRLAYTIYVRGQSDMLAGVIVN